MNENDFQKVPYYLQIRKAIFDKIVSGEYKAGMKLPSEDKLALSFNVSRLTVNKALTELVNQDYLTRVRGSGTYVSKIRREGLGQDLLGFAASMTYRGFAVSSQVLLQEIITPDKSIAEDLKISISKPILHLKRVREINSEPIVLQDAYINVDPAASLLEVNFERSTLYNMLEEKCNQKVVYAKDKVEAIEANPEISIELNVPIGFPILRVRRISYNEINIPIEFTYSYYRSDQYVLEIEYK